MRKLIELTASNQKEASFVIETKLFDETKSGVFFGSSESGRLVVTFIAKESPAALDYGSHVSISSYDNMEYYTFSEVTSLDGANALYNDLSIIGLSGVIEKYNGAREL